MCGRGKLFYQSGKVAYDGQLENDLFHGTGILYNEVPEPLPHSFDYSNFEDIDENWISYEGNFVIIQGSSDKTRRKATECCC